MNIYTPDGERGDDVRPQNNQITMQVHPSYLCNQGFVLVEAAGREPIFGYCTVIIVKILVKSLRCGIPTYFFEH